jgi:glycosyltransferase involved in cell wall biosynthesis
MIEEGVSGRLFTVKRSDELARISEPLIEDVALRVRMSKAARRRAAELFSKERCAAIHLEAYKVALSGSRQMPPRRRVSDTAHSPSPGM